MFMPEACVMELRIDICLASFRPGLATGGSLSLFCVEYFMAMTSSGTCC
jgi:hypothetical protein